MWGPGEEQEPDHPGSSLAFLEDETVLPKQHGLGLRPSSISLSTKAKTLGLTDWPPLVSSSSETELPFMSMLGIHIILQGTAGLRWGRDISGHLDEQGLTGLVSQEWMVY